MTSLNFKDPLTKAGFDLLMADNNQAVVYGALKHLGQRKNDPNYEDMFQEGCLVFVQAYVAFRKNYPLDWEKVTGQSQCLKYCYRKVRWFILDQLKRGTYICQHCVTGDSTVDDGISLLENYTDPDSRRHLRRLENKDLWRRIYQTGTVCERRFLEGVLDLHLTGRQLAAHYHVTPQTVSGWRRQIINHARRLLNIVPPKN